MSLKGFMQKDEEKEKERVERKKATTPEAVEKRMSEYKDTLNAKWGDVRTIDIDKLPKDKEGVPYIAVRVDEDVVSWINDLEATLNIPLEQVMHDSLSFHHSIMTWAIYKVTGDPIYQRRKKVMSGEVHQVMDFVGKEVQAIQNRLNMIKGLEEELKRMIEDGDNVGQMEHDNQEEAGDSKEKSERNTSEKSDEKPVESTWT